LTEVTAIATGLLPADHERALREKPRLLLACGRALMGTAVRVVDADDRPVPAETIGEILIRGPQLMRGYWNRAEANEESLRGGWMHTGDAGSFDDEGYLYVQDRVKDMIVSGGRTCTRARSGTSCSATRRSQTRRDRRARRSMGRSGEGDRGTRGGLHGERRGDHRLLPRAARVLQAPPQCEFLAALRAIRAARS
jgi:hypothetical protein